MLQAGARIGVFDSGMGGLTVLRALQAQMPNAAFIYLGDTARLPYGTKSATTVQRYAVRAAAELVSRGISALVVACNTASAVALDALREAYPGIPVYGVVEPGAAAACAVPGVRRVAVLATESTVAGGAYQRALLARAPQLIIRARPCPLLVTLAEEGWLHGEIPQAVLTGYLRDWLRWAPDCLLLGCTHFPIFRDNLQQICGSGMVIVDSAATTAAVVARDLRECWALRKSERNTAASLHLLATDDVRRFKRVGQYFLGKPLGDVELIDL